MTRGINPWRPVLVWAVEMWIAGPHWRATEGSLYTSRERARMAMKWLQQQFPGKQFRVRAYARRASS